MSWCTVHCAVADCGEGLIYPSFARIIVCEYFLHKRPTNARNLQFQWLTPLSGLCGLTPAVSVLKLSSQTTAWFWYNLNLNGKIWLWNILPGCSEETNSCWRYRHWYRWYRRRQYSPLRAPYIPCTSQSSLRLFSLAKYYISSLRTLLLTKKPTKGGDALSLKVIQISRVKNRTWKPTRADIQQATWSNEDVRVPAWANIAVNMSYFLIKILWCTGNSRIKSLGVSYLERFMSAINGCHVLSGNHSFNWHLNSHRQVHLLEATI